MVNSFSFCATQQVFTAVILLAVVQQALYVGGAGATQSQLSIHPASQSNLYILLLGTSGCGKSSTINFLVNKPIAGVGHLNSTTSAIHEYSVQFSAASSPPPADGASGNITFIDTPGFGDTRGLEYDARFLASLEQYLQTHAELSRRKPDVVLLCHRYDDNRFSGQQSQFVKMMRGIGLTSELWYWYNYGHGQGPDKTTNAAILLTHARADVDGERRIPMYRQTLENYTQFPSSLTVLLGDNKLSVDLGKPSESEDSDEESSEIEIPIRQLSSGSPGWFPDNLCTWMKTVVSMSPSGSPTHTAMIDKLCKLQYNVVEETAQFKFLDVHDTKARQFMQTLTKLELRIDETPVSLQLATAYHNLTAQGQGHSYKFKPDTLPYLQKTLNLLHIIAMNDVPETVPDTARLFKRVRSDEGTLRLLKTAFGIQPPALIVYPQVSPLLNMFDMSELRASPLGYKIPTALSCTYQQSIGPSVTVYRPLDTIHTLMLEFRFIRCQLNQAARLHARYLQTVASLGSFDQNDYSSVLKWKSFWDMYGSHVVQESYLGGSIQLSGIPSSLTVSVSNTDELLHILQAHESTVDVEIRMSGGSHAYQVNGNQATARKFFSGPLQQRWIDSVADNPVPLPLTLLKSLAPVPASDYLRQVNASLADELTRATSYFSTVNTRTLADSLRGLQDQCASTRTNLDSQTEATETCKSTLATCTHDRNMTTQQNYEIAQKLAESKATVRELQTKLTALELEKGRLHSENENHKAALAAARAENLKEQAHSQQLNGLLQECNTQAIDACTSRRHGHHHRRHGHHGHRHGHHGHRNRDH